MCMLLSCQGPTGSHEVCAIVMQVALSLANLAALMQAQGRTSAAEELVRRALSIREDALGPDHPLVNICSGLQMLSPASPHLYLCLGLSSH